MKIYHLRYATSVVEINNHSILIDPMLDAKGSLPSLCKVNDTDNPQTSLPSHIDTDAILNTVTTGLITSCCDYGISEMQSTPHLDIKGCDFLCNHSIPILTNIKDGNILEKNGLKIEQKLPYWQEQPFLNGKIIAIPAYRKIPVQRGHMWFHTLKRHGSGYFINLPHQPRIYISGESAYTNDIEKVLETLQPDISLLAVGTVQSNQPIAMTITDLYNYRKKSKGKIVVTHLDAINSSYTRKAVQMELKQYGIADTIDIPNDGDTIIANI